MKRKKNIKKKFSEIGDYGKKKIRDLEKILHNYCTYRNEDDKRRDWGKLIEVLVGDFEEGSRSCDYNIAVFVGSHLTL